MSEYKNDPDGERLAPPSTETAARNAEIASALSRLATAATLDDIMAAATGAVRTHLKAGGATLVLREGDTSYYAAGDAITPAWRGRRIPMAMCISGWCMRQRRPAFVPDIYKDPRMPHAAFRPTLAKSLAVVPLPLHDPVAALGAYWPTIREISSRELGLLLAFGDAAAPAVMKLGDN